MTAPAPGFGRVLAGTVTGALLAGWACHFQSPAWELGAVLGARWAAGRGGTARWVALAASFLILWAGAWVITSWCFANGLDWPPLVTSYGWRAQVWVSRMILLGGWSVLVWRSLVTLGGGAIPPGALPLALVGWLSGRIVLALAGGLLIRCLIRFSWRVDPVLFVPFTASLAGISLLCGLGALASLGGNLDLPWASATFAAGLLGALVTGSWVALENTRAAYPVWVPVLAWFLVEIGWFSWWARRVVRGRLSDGEGPGTMPAP